MGRPRLRAAIGSILLLGAGAARCAAAPVASSALIPAASAASPAADLSLEDLGISATQSSADPRLQAQLERRTWMLKTHQLLGLATAVPMVLTAVLSPDHPDNGQRVPGQEDRTPPSRSSVHAHMALGIATTALYATTASFALLAPNPGHPAPRGSSRIHRWLAWIHGPLMVAVPTLGFLADARLKEGKSAGTLGDVHGAAQAVLIGSYLAAVTVMVLNF